MAMRKGLRKSDLPGSLFLSGKLGVFLDVYHKVGLPTLLVFLGIAVFFGWIPSPVTAFLEQSKLHHRNFMALTCHVIYGDDQEAKGKCLTDLVLERGTP